MKSSQSAALLKELELLVMTGMGVPPIAPALFSVLSKLVGAEAGGMCWFSEAGVPEGFYHVGATSAVEDLLINHYDELFVGRHEYNPFWYSRNKGLSVGNTLIASKEYLRSNTHNLLIKPSNWHFLLDAMVDLDGISRLTICFFRAVKNPFTENDARRLTALIPLLRRIFYTRSKLIVNQQVNLESGHMLISEDGLQVHMIDSLATQLLAKVRLIDQDISMLDRSNIPPQFVTQMAEQLRRDPSQNGRKEFELAGGTLLVSTCRMTASSQLESAAEGARSATNVLVSLEFKPSAAIESVRSISAWGLSPLQGRIAMYAAAGGRRMDCAAHHNVSKEALKKHLREIYAASNCIDWLELGRTLQNSSVLTK